MVLIVIILIQNVVFPNNFSYVRKTKQVEIGNVSHVIVWEITYLTLFTAKRSMFAWFKNWSANFACDCYVSNHNNRVPLYWIVIIKSPQWMVKLFRDYNRSNFPTQYFGWLLSSGAFHVCLNLNLNEVETSAWVDFKADWKLLSNFLSRYVCFCCKTHTVNQLLRINKLLPRLWSLRVSYFEKSLKSPVSNP